MLRVRTKLSFVHNIVDIEEGCLLTLREWKVSDPHVSRI